MKIQKCIPMLLVLLSFSFLEQLYSQSLCLETPIIRTELEACNSNIAHAFAPEIHQQTRLRDDAESFPEDFYLADIPTAVNYDGNWEAIDNWENISNSTLSNPSVYFAVWWLEESWVIRYYLYYPRDWANPGCGIFGWDEHEHDIEVVTVMVRRPLNQAEADDPSLLSYGTSVSNHGNRDYASCPPSSAGTPDVTYAQGSHPIVFSSIGSHAIYYTAGDALLDSPLNPCKPIPNFTLTYFPSSATPPPSLSCGTNSCNQPYSLINMFNPTNGLWARKDTSSLWNGDKLWCDNGGSCRAGKPWAGGADRPACEFINNVGELCNSVTGESTPANSVGCNNYIYNGYCDTVITAFRIKETICCGTTVRLDGIDTEGEDRYKIDIKDLQNNSQVSSGWVDETLTFVDLDELWRTETSGGRFQADNTYQVCLTPRGCTWGDSLCKQFRVIQPAFDFQLWNDLGQIVPDGGTMEPGSEPLLDPTELYCLRNYKIKICESPILEGDLGENDDCNWFFSDLQYDDDPVNLVDAVSTGWPNTFSFQDGYQYQICMYSESTCTETQCQTIKVKRSTGVVCGEEHGADVPFCYRVFTAFCPPESDCDPCNLGGAICVYESPGIPLDLNDYIFMIDFGSYTIESLTPCFQFTAQQTPLITGFHVYNILTGITDFVPLDLCDTGLGGDEGKVIGGGEADILSKKARASHRFSVSPNPATEAITITAPEIENGEVRITDLLGRVVYREPFALNSNIDLSSWSDGIYLITILDDQLRSVETQKIVKH